MTGRDDLERSLARWLEGEATGVRPPARRDQAIEATRTRRPRPAFVAGVGSSWIGDGPGVVALPHGWRIVTITALLVLALAAAALYVGSQPRRFPSLVVPAGNGLIAYASGGDIYVGDPLTGRTTAIVSGPELDSGPRFSPDGTRIAFLRGDPFGDASIVVVHSDGADPRVVVPVGFSKGVGFTWMPDGTALVINYDDPANIHPFDGQLGVVDASGGSPPRRLTPPMHNWPGTSYFNPNAPVAPMFRPPAGDRVLDSSYQLFVEMNPDGSNVRELIDLTDEDVPRTWMHWPAWSPDATKVAILAGNGPDVRLLVMNADGSDLRRLGREGARGTLWSPDGTRIAYERSPVCTSSVIAIVDVVSGTERVLEVTRGSAKHEGQPPADVDPNCPGYVGDEGRGWTYEGWSWSPDGQSIVMLERSGTHPLVVDIETGQATELPWLSDSAQSWQPVPGN